MRYSDQVIEEVRLRSSLSELVSERTEVKRSGSSMTACCPFHSEKTPSFHINEEQGLYYCFGCGKKGNTFTFVMETRGLSFPESVRYLAQKYSVPLPVSSEPSQFERGLAKKKGLLRKILFETQNLYEDILWDRSSVSKDGSFAKEILHAREIHDQTIKRYRLGFTGLKSGYLFQEIKKIVSQSMDTGRGQSGDRELLDALFSLGLLRKYTNNQTGELFRERIIFPIARSDGNPIAFGGRIVHSETELPKYINSPESPVYEKRRSFYGLPQAISSIQKSKTAYIVEGYTDVLSFHQAGIENTIAVCGTALTEDHTKILSRFISRAYLVFDADPAGRVASARSFTAFMNSGIEAIPVFLPEGEDPDSIARKVFRGALGKDELYKIIQEGETSLLKIFLQSTAASLLGHERGTLTELGSLRASEHGKLAESVAAQIVQIKNPVEKELRIREVCSLLGVTESSFKHVLNGTPGSASSPSSNKTVPVPASNSNGVTKEDDQNSKKHESLFSRRLKEIKKQLVVAVLVDPSILRSETVYNEALELTKEDEPHKTFFETLYKMISEGSVPYRNGLLTGLSAFLSKGGAGDSGKSILLEEALALYHSILCRCGIEAEGYIDEAVKQVTMGGVLYPELADSLRETISRINLSNKVDALRMEEANSENESEKMKLIQEKLLMKRSLDKFKRQ